MPAFSALGVLAAEAIIGGGFATAAAAATAGAWGFVAVASVVAAGAAMVASRLINGGGSSSGSGGTSQDPGVRIQLPPATDNKIPIIYGTANTRGMVTDARISADNQQMTYVLVLGEKTDTGNFSVGDIYWNDELLTFDTGSNNYKVLSSRDQNGQGTTSTNLAGLVEMRVYAGSAQTSTTQIFPTTNKVAAATYIGESTSTYLLSDLIYVVVKLTYSAEKSVTGLPQMTFEITNDLNNPGSVLYDYLTNARYGAGIAATDIDITSMTGATATSLLSISNEIPNNQYNSDGSTSTQARYIINGVLSTGNTVKNNLEKITQASSSWLTYDFTQGKWTVKPNRALSSGELANCIVYDDDSIMGEITVNATNLEDLYNSLEVEFPSREIRDQNDYFRATVDPTERNNLEPDNLLSLRYDLINNAIHAQRLGLIELNQSRVDRTIQFNTTYRGLQTSAGDVIKVTNEVYGFTEKLFRVTRVREVEADGGALTAEITALEYLAGVYGDTSITDYTANTASGIPNFSSAANLPAPSAVTTGASFPSSNQPYFNVSTTISATSGPVDRIQWFYFTGSNYVYVTDEVGPFNPGQTVSDSIAGLPAGAYNLYARSIKDSISSAYSSAPAGTFNWNPQPGGVNNGTISTATFSSQVQIVNTTSGALKIPLVATTSGFQPVYADSELSYDAASNLLSAGGLALSTGSVVQKVVSSGGFPLNAAGTASILLNFASPSAIVSNYSGGLVPSITLRGYGQNRPGGISTTAGNPTIALESSRGTNSSPTRVVALDSLGGITAGGYDGNNWPSDQHASPYNFLGFFATETANFDSVTTTATTVAGSGITLFVQPGWTRPLTTTGITRHRALFSNWTTSTTAPSQLNLFWGSGVAGAESTATLLLANGNTYIGPGRTNFSLLNSTVNIYGVPQQDTAPDNSGLTATNAINFFSGRRSAVSGRRNIIQNGDNIGVLSFSGQTTDNSTGFGSVSANIIASAIETFSGSVRGSQIAIKTTNTGTNTLSDRLVVSDRQNTHNSDTHLFRDKSGSFNALSVTTATATFTAIPVLPVYTVATKPLTGTVGQIICISDSAGGGNPNGMIAFWDTTNARWSYIHTNAAV